MNEIINVNYDSDQPTVLGRDLHEALEINTKYVDWFSRMCEYGFSDGLDYFPILRNRSDGKAGKPLTDHQITIPMAKEICMIQRSEKGKMCRQYFISIEEQWNTPEAVMARALQISNHRLDELKNTNLMLESENARQKQIIGELKPKSDYTDKILNNKGLVTISQIAKDYGMSGRKMNNLLHEFGVQYKQSGQWLLYAKYHDKGYTHSKTIDITRSDGTPDVTMETKWTQKGRLFIYDLLKSKGVLPLIERESSAA